jgi:hypothetical protein
MHDFILMAQRQIRDMLVFELDSVSETLAFGRFNMAVVDSVMLWRCV